MPPIELDPYAAQVSLAELSDLFHAPVAVVSSPEFQLNGKNAMKITEQLAEKLKPEKESRVVSIVDFQGSTSGGWVNQKIRNIEPNGKKTLHSGDFDLDLTNSTEFQQYLKEHHDEFSQRAQGDEGKMRELAKKGFAIKNSQWNSYWRGKVAGGLTMALSTMKPSGATVEECKKCGIGRFIGMDIAKMHVAIAVCIDGGPVTQEEQRTVTTMVDEVVFDLRRRGADWAKNTAILIVRFPDSESFLKSLDGERNLMRATTRFPTRQHDECLWKKIYHLGLAWEVPDQTVTYIRGESMLQPGMTIEKALMVQTIPHPAMLLQIAMTGDTVGVKRMIDARCSIQEATSKEGYSALHACASENYADTADVLLKAHCNQQYLDAVALSHHITPLYCAAQFGAYDTAKLLLEKGATVNKGRDGQAPVHKAAHKGHKAIVEMLAKYGADLHTPADYGPTPLCIAAQHGHCDVVRYLIDKKADMNTPIPGGLTPIAAAAEEQQGDVVKLLARCKAELNKYGTEGETALFKAASRNLPDVVKYLVQSNADANIANSKGEMPLKIAQANKFSEVVKALS